MTSKSLLPQAFWFRFAVRAPYVEGIPRTAKSRGLLNLPASCILPDLSRLEGQDTWAEVRAAWNPGGLGFMVLAEGVSEAQLALDHPDGFASVQFWVDTRDTRDVKRATRFCHRFVAQIKPTGSTGNLAVEVTQKPIARALADAPLCLPEVLSSRVELKRSKWVLELFLPASALHGFDPELNRRLGFAYQVSDRIREDQYLGVGPAFPVGENPSLWATLELVEG
jgi:hypothetical protein